MIKTTPSILQPPELVRGMTVLDKSKFHKEVRNVPILKVRSCIMHSIMSLLSPHLLKMEKFKPIQDGDCDSEKIIYLHPNLIKSFDSFAKELKISLAEMNIGPTNLEFRDITLNYDNWKGHEIITAILPPSLNFSGYSIIGNIVHVNLREGLYPYKNVIGEVLKDKVAHCRCVVNKIGIIDNVYRNFEMEILSGDSDTETETKENGCRFKMDFSHVYWNPRLHEEHCRIINLISEGDILYDVFAGIGPFSLPIAKKGCHVLANDLNPESYRWLNHNVQMNKVANRISTFNKDGEHFIKEDFRKDYLMRIRDDEYKNSKFHITMNLPSSAYKFLSAFANLFTSDELVRVQEHSLPIVYLYCFLKNKTNTLIEIRQLTEIMGKSKNSYTNAVKSNIFKVAGCKSLKVKNKAKVVTHERMKSVQLKNKQKVEDIDKQLSILDTEVRQSSRQENQMCDDSSTVCSRSIKRLDEIGRHNETQKSCQEALERLSAMEML